MSVVTRAQVERFHDLIGERLGLQFDEGKSGRGREPTTRAEVNHEQP
jgi:hypothetical protein